MASRHASSSNFSMNGSPTCTLGRFCCDSSVNSVEAGLCANVNYGIAGALSFGEKQILFLRDAKSQCVHQRILRIAGLEANFAAHGRHAETISVVSDAPNHTVEDAAVLRGFFFARALACGDLAETQGIQNGDRPRAHGENVA